VLDGDVAAKPSSQAAPSRLSYWRLNDASARFTLPQPAAGAFAATSSNSAALGKR
jgi:hypothetical protein